MTATARWVHRVTFVIVATSLAAVVFALLRFGPVTLFTLALAAPVFDERWIAAILKWFDSPASLPGTGSWRWRRASTGWRCFA